MNALQSFISSKPCGFITDRDLPALIALDRLCPLLVRCGGCRFTCGAQDIPHLLHCIKAGGDYVRDISFPVGSFERAANWQPEPPHPIRPARSTAAGATGEQWQENKGHLQRVVRFDHRFNEADCGGAFDGNQVSSDADPGL